MSPDSHLVARLGFKCGCWVVPTAAVVAAYCVWITDSAGRVWDPPLLLKPFLFLGLYLAGPG